MSIACNKMIAYKIYNSFHIKRIKSFIHSFLSTFGKCMKVGLYGFSLSIFAHPTRL